MNDNILKNKNLANNLYLFCKSITQDNNIQNFLAKSGDLTMKYKDNLIHSYYDPVKEASKLVLNKKIEKKIIIVLGLGLGYHIKELLKKTNGIIVVIELFPQFVKNAYENIDLSFLEKVIFFYDKIENLYDFLMQTLPEEYCNSVEILPLVSIVKLFQKEYEETILIINKVLSIKLQSYITTLGFGERWILNILKNYLSLKNFITLNLNQKINLPVFILASGPTLEYAINYIEIMKKKGYVFSLSHSLFFLAKNNVYPDFVFAIDAGFALRYHFLGLPKEIYSKTILITTLSVYPDIIKFWKGKVLLINIDLPLENKINENGIFLPSKGTVSATAFQFAKIISNGPYYFAGLDLAYTFNKYHHKFSLTEQKFIYQNNKFSPIETILITLMKKLNLIIDKNARGETIYTNRSMKSYQEWFDNEFIKNKVYIFGKDGIFFKNATYIDYNELNKLQNIKKKFHFIEKKINFEKTKKIINEILEILENKENILDSTNDVIKMQFSRYKINQTGFTSSLLKAKKIYRKALNYNFYL